MKKRVKGKGRVEPCEICGEDRESYRTRFPKRARDGGTETVKLCPLHHRLLNDGRVNKTEIEKLWKNKYPQIGKTVDEFVKWANNNGYRYTLVELKDKFWDE